MQVRAVQIYMRRLVVCSNQFAPAAAAAGMRALLYQHAAHAPRRPGACAGVATICRSAVTVPVHAEEGFTGILASKGAAHPLCLHLILPSNYAPVGLCCM